VPFKTEDGQDLPDWVSRFDIYPYLERYAEVCTPFPRDASHSFSKDEMHHIDDSINLRIPVPRSSRRCRGNQT
jgi:hypothetical protein